MPNAAVLVDTGRCPACFTALVTTRCAACGLDMTAAGGAEVLAASQRVVGALAERDRAIAAMRAAQLQAESAAVASRVPPPAAPDASVVAPSPSPAPDAPTTTAAPTASTDRPRRSTVQIALLVAGVVAVSVAVVFFALVAVLFATPQVRAGILAAAAAAVLLGAARLQRRLPATAEGVAVAGLVMLLLELLLVRTAFDLTRVDGGLYAGLGALVVAGVGVLLAARARLRAGAVAAAALPPGAVALTCAGALTSADVATRVWLAGLAAALAAGAGLWLCRRVPSIVLRVQGLLAGLVALAAATAVPVADPALRIGTVGTVSAVAALWLLVARRRRPVAWAVDVQVAGGVAGIAAVVAAGVGLQPSTGPMTLLPLLAVAPTAAAVAAVRTGGLRRTVALVTACCAVAAATVAAFPAIIRLGTIAAGPLSALLRPFGGDPRFAPELGVADAVTGTLGLAALLALAGLAARRRAPWTAAAATLAVGALATAAADGTATALLPTAALVGAVAVAALAFLADRDPRSIVALAVLRIAVATLGTLSLLTPNGWLPASGIAVLLLAILRVVSRGPVRAAVASGTIVGALGLVAATLVPWAAAAGAPLPVAVPEAAAPFVFAGLALLVVAVPGARVAVVERRAVEAVASAVLLLASAGLVTAGDPAAARAAAIGLAAVAVAGLRWVRLPGTLGEPVAAPVVGPLAAIGAALAAGTAAAPSSPTAAVLAAAIVSLVLAVAAVGWVRPTLRAAWTVTLVLATGGALALLPSVPAAGWTVPLLLTAGAATVLAFGRGDPFRAPLPQRAAGWAAVGLVLVALWRVLVDRAVVDVEPYTLPAAAALVGVALVAAVRSDDGRARGGLAVAGFALALVPSAIAMLTGPNPRDVVVAVAAAAAVAVSVVAPAGWRGIAVRVPLVAIGAPVLAFATLVGGGRLIPAVGLPDLWVLPPAALLCGVALLHLDERHGAIAVGAPLAAGSIALMCFGADAATRPDVDTRVVVALLLLGVTALGAARLATGALRASAVPLVAGGVVTAVAVFTRFGGDRPLEFATVPYAAALVAIGVQRLRDDRALGTWPALGPGLAVLLLPSLALDATTGVTWRVVGLGLVAVAVLLVGAMRALSAPFLIGSGVFVVHVVVQLWPWLQQVYLAAWWLWIGVAGALLIAIAATYERRVRDLRSAARLIGDLR